MTFTVRYGFFASDSGHGGGTSLVLSLPLQSDTRNLTNSLKIQRLTCRNQCLM